MKSAFAALAVIVFSLAMIVSSPPEVVLKVQKGIVTLECQFSDGKRVVPGDKVIDLVDNTWVFTNGSATNCTVR